MNPPIPEALYPCAICKEDYSHPATDLFWNDRLRDWVCSNCWDYDADEKRGVSMEDEIKRHSIDWEGIAKDQKSEIKDLKDEIRQFELDFYDRQ